MIAEWDGPHLAAETLLHTMEPLHKNLQIELGEMVRDGCRAHVRRASCLNAPVACPWMVGYSEVGQQNRIRGNLVGFVPISRLVGSFSRNVVDTENPN